MRTALLFSKGQQLWRNDGTILRGKNENDAINDKEGFLNFQICRENAAIYEVIEQLKTEKN